MGGLLRSGAGLVVCGKIERGSMDYDLKSYVCIHIFDNLKPILYVCRDEGDWCFLCGAEHPQDPAYYRTVGIGHVLDAHPELNELLDLGRNEEAERAEVGQPWIRSPLDSTAH